jgi:hypothetical protein
MHQPPSPPISKLFIMPAILKKKDYSKKDQLRKRGRSEIVGTSVCVAFAWRHDMPHIYDLAESSWNLRQARNSSNITIQSRETVIAIESIAVSPDGERFILEMVT